MGRDKITDEYIAKQELRKEQAKEKYKKNASIKYIEKMKNKRDKKKKSV